MAKRELASSDICAIIKSCAENGVVTLKFDGLELAFEHLEKISNGIAPEPLIHTRPATEIAENQKHIAKKSLLKDEASLREEELALMVIENPLEAERLIMAGELSEDDYHGNEGLEGIDD